MSRLLMLFAIMLASPAWAEGPDIMGTWSKSCPTRPDSGTVSVDSEGVLFAGRRCRTPSWERANGGWRSALVCDGRAGVQEIVVMPRGEGRALIDLGGQGGLFARCEGEKSDLLARLEGTWARDREACSLYLSGELDKSRYDMSTLRKYEISIFWDGYFKMKYNAIRCSISQIGTAIDDVYGIESECEMRDYPIVRSIGKISFKGVAAINFDGGANLSDGYFGPLDLVKCN